MSFTAFNIRLDDGTETKPGDKIFNTCPVWLAVKRCLSALYPQGFAGLRVADLACLEGGYAVELARMGFGEVIGIEVRDANFANCVKVKNGVNLSNLKFAQDDVWNLPAYGDFDVIFCGGILYHLDKPKQFLELISKCCSRAILINTHFSTAEHIEKFSLSDMTKNEGLPGRWFAEGNKQDPWASWGNSNSFWKEHLIQAIRDAGFPMVFEQHDVMGDNIAEALTSTKRTIEPCSSA